MGTGPAVPSAHIYTRQFVSVFSQCNITLFLGCRSLKHKFSVLSKAAPDRISSVRRELSLLGYGGGSTSMGCSTAETRIISFLLKKWAKKKKGKKYHFSITDKEPRW